MAEYIVGFIVFVLGLVIGSFLNVVALRVLASESVVYPPSHCPSCKHRLAAKDLIPVLSYLFLKGRCRYCQERISPQYPVVELLTGILFTALYIKYQFSMVYLEVLIFTAVMIVTTVTDLKEFAVPHNLVLLSAALIFILKFIDKQPGLLFNVITAVVLFFLMWVLSRFGLMGEGDAPLAALIGITFGPLLSIAALFWAVVCGGAVGVALVLKDKQDFKREVPFGPFLALGSLIAIFSESAVMNYFNNLYQLIS